MFFKASIPTVAVWLLATPGLWPDDRSKAVLALAAGVAVLVVFAISVVAPRLSAAAARMTAVIAVLLAAINLGLGGDQWNTASLATSAATLLFCALARGPRRGGTLGTAGTT